MPAAAALLLAAAAPADLPPFTFREHRSGTNYSQQGLRDAGCKELETYTLCSGSSDINGIWVSTTYSIVDRRLADFTISGFRQDIPEVLDLFRAKYGPPCDSGSEPVQNRIGNTFQSATFTWCFATGKAVFHERQSRLDWWAFTYTDDLVRIPPRNVTPDF